MADRTVSARLRADVTGYIAAMRAATTATRQLADEADRVGRRTSGSFEDARRSSERASRSFQGAGEAARHSGRQMVEAGEAARRSSEQVERASIAARRAQLAAAAATERARQAQQQASEAAQRLARGEISRAEAERLAARAAREAERADIARTEASLRQSDASRRQAAATQQQTVQIRNLRGAAFQARGALASLVAGGVAAGAAVTSAGAAFGVFGVVALPTLVKVVTAQKDLATNWSTLTTHQRVAALSVNALVDEFKDLARSYEPHTLAAFNQILANTRSLLPQLDRVMAATAGGVGSFTAQIGGFVAGPEMRGFLDFVAAQAPAALQQVGTALTTTGGLSLSLIQDLAPIRSVLLDTATGALGLVRALAEVDPMLAQMAVSALLLRGPVTGLIAGVTALSTRMRAFAASTAAATRAQKAFAVDTSAGPAAAVLAAAGLLVLISRVKNTRTETDKLVESWRVQTGAIGNNVVAYGRLIQVLERRHAQEKALVDAERAHRDSNEGLTRAGYKHYQAQVQLQLALDETRKQQKNVTDGAELLSRQFGISKDSALSLATAAGVDLSKGITGSGDAASAARNRVYAYQAAVEQASDPTRQISLALDDAADSALTMKDRVTALTTALDAVFNPSIATYKATTQLKSGFRELISALDAAGGRMDGNSQASTRLRERFASQLETVRDLYTATFNQTHSLRDAQVAVRDQLPILYALAGNNREARRQVDALARSTGNTAGVMDISRDAFLRAASSMGIAADEARDLWGALSKIRSRKVNVDVTARGLWTTAHDPSRRIPGLATGGPVPALWTGANRAYDSQPALLRVDEHVWTPEEVDAVGGHGAMYRMRQLARQGKLRGYAAGGRVSLSSGETAADVIRPIRAGYTEMISTVAQTLADAWKKFAASGGGVVAAARQWLGTPYSWGGGGIGGPSLGIGRGAGTVGFDCSGLTEYAWFQGRKIDIGGTTYAQHPASVPSARRPGALGFNSSLGHVVIASDQPGMVIEAPFTGSHVREVRKDMPDWRWPKAAGYAAGGQVKALADQAIAGRAGVVDSALARLLQIAGSGPRGPERHDAQIARPGAMRLWAEPETGGEAYIPLAPTKRARSMRILGTVARKFGVGLTSMADGGIISYADGGGFDSADLNLSDILSRWEQAVNPASKSDVRSAAKNRRAQLDQLRNAEAALRRARKSGDHDRIAAAERKVRKEREDLTEATEKLRAVEARYKAGRLQPAARLDAALSLGIKNTGAFIRNLTTLADRGFGTLARELLEMGGPDAEKIAASAVKMSNKKLSSLQNKIDQSKRQQQTLEAMPNILTARSALKSGKVTTWMDLIKATNLPPDDLAAALRLMQSDLFKTKHGRQIWAQMIAQGYAAGGVVSGPSGIDRVPIWATDGEFVVNARSTAANRPLLEAVNADQSGAILRRLIPYTSPVGGQPRGGDGASAPLIGQLNVNHVPGYSTWQDLSRAFRQAELTGRYHRRR